MQQYLHLYCFAILGSTSNVIHNVNQRLLRNLPGSDSRDFSRLLARKFTVCACCLVVCTDRKKYCLVMYTDRKKCCLVMYTGRKKCCLVVYTDRNKYSLVVCTDRKKCFITRKLFNLSRSFPWTKNRNR